MRIVLGGFFSICTAVGRVRKAICLYNAIDLLTVEPMTVLFVRKGFVKVSWRDIESVISGLMLMIAINVLN